MLAHEAGQFKRAPYVERVAKSEGKDILWWERTEFVTKRRAQRKRSINFVPAPGERIGEISQMPFATANRAR
jgi:hypothetical protein